MFKHQDQAEGLRKIMGKNAPRIIGVLSTVQPMPTRWLHTLASHMAQPEARTLLIQHQHDKYTPGIPALQQIAMQQAPLSQATRSHPLGFDRACLFENSPVTPPLSAHTMQALDGIVRQLSSHYDTVMIEAHMQSTHELTLPLLAEQTLVIHMPHDENAITAAYSLIKRICMQYGERGFGIVISQASRLQGQHMFMRLQQVCQQFLGISLHFLGAIPQETPTVAAPASPGSQAFRQLASNLDKHAFHHAALVAA